MTPDEAIAWVNAAPTGEERAWRKHLTFHVRYPARGLPIHALDTTEKARAALDEYYRLFPEARKYLEGKLATRSVGYRDLRAVGFDAYVAYPAVYRLRGMEEPRTMRERKKHQRSENAVVLLSFVRYCDNHPQLRFWQALASWAMIPKLFANVHEDDTWRLEDTFYWTGRKGDQL